MAEWYIQFSRAQIIILQTGWDHDTKIENEWIWFIPIPISTSHIIKASYTILPNSNSPIQHNVLEEVIERMWQLADPWAGLSQTQAPRPDSCRLNLHAHHSHSGNCSKHRALSRWGIVEAIWTIHVTDWVQISI